ncbi:MAG: Unknown protein [uncultured Thiotrichaceae bacterium]|uniref:H-type lectin domain-containing protein n=1 Tax=uncultured Thiotrichaceae bacterium TaxID=298394 RepID=A0A6S6TWY9_9GAMM|nr:MAG: Unknown protein [uncultured Thiotrichaceae bacterium]
MESILRLFSLLFFVMLIFGHSSLMAAQLIAGSQTYTSTFGGGYTTVSLTPNFTTTPVVFVLPTTDGSNPSNVRIRNVTTSSFQASPTEPHREDGPHIAMQSSSISVDTGNYTLPDGTKFEVDSVSSTAQQFGTGNTAGTSTWQQVTFNVPFNSVPIVVATLQTMNNEVGEGGQLPPEVSSLPFLDVAIRNITTTGFQIAMERSEIADGSVVTPETIGYMAMEEATGSFVDDNNNTIVYKAFSYNGARGWSDNCIRGNFPGGAFSSTPIVMASKRSRNNPDGGWVRRCYLSTTQVGIKIDEDRETEGDNERSVAVAEAESVSVLAFSRSFVLAFLNTYVPVFDVSKQLTTLSDPANHTNNPKSIPGAIIEYAITVTNTGNGAADPNTFNINDAIPANTSLVVSGLSCGGAVQFIDGSPNSGLSCGTVEFSQDGGDYSYSPTPGGDNNTDSSVRYIRIKPNGTFNAGSPGSSPNVTFKFRVEVN